MQESDETTEKLDKRPINRKQLFKKLFDYLRGISSKSSSAKTIEQIFTDLKDAGAKDEDIQSFKELLSIFDEHSKNKAIFVQADTFILGGLTAINIVILQALISLGKLDAPSVIALLALGISIPTAAGYLFIRFIQEKYHIETYEWRIISYIPFVAMFGGWIGITFAIWHALWLAGVIFLVTSFIIGGIGVLYFEFVGMREVGMKRSKTTQTNSTKEPH